MSGILHLLFGAIGFIAVAAAAFAHAAWSRSIGAPRRALVSAILGAVVLLAFGGGVALSPSPTGILLIWIAVLAQFVWLALASAHIYAWSPTRCETPPRRADRRNRDNSRTPVPDSRRRRQRLVSEGVGRQHLGMSPLPPARRSWGSATSTRVLVSA